VPVQASERSRPGPGQDFARDACELQRFLPGLPVAPARYDALVQAVAHLDEAPSVDELLGLTLTGPAKDC
jgi:hypothetical protein